MSGIRGELSEKHWQALKLLGQGLPRKEVAAHMKWSYDYLGDLCAGDISKAGYTAELFKKQVMKTEETRDENTNTLIKVNALLIQELIFRVLKELEAKRKLSMDDKRLIVALCNSLNKSKAQTEVKSVAYSYVDGLTPEEMIYEYQRLTAIAENSFNNKKRFNEG